jgi:hypothetical protein
VAAAAPGTPPVVETEGSGVRLGRVLFGVAILAALLAVTALLPAAPPPVAAQPAAVGGSSAAGAMPPTVVRVPGSTRKVCQLTGEIDRERGVTTAALSQTRYGLVGTDLGSVVQHGGRLIFLFGDSQPSRTGTSDRPVDGDSIGFTLNLTAKDCTGLHFVTAADGFYRSPHVPGVSLAGFEVPTGGFSAGESMYVFFTTDSTADQVMGRSVLARSDDGGQSFAYVTDVSRDRFINVAPVVVSNAAVPGLPSTAGRGVLMWASGAYRQSDPYLAWAPLEGIERHTTWRYFAGIDPETRRPRWSETETRAAPLFSHPCIGELSVAWLMLYNCDNPRGIVYRVAAEPWGPWSPAAILFDPWADRGYCHFIHVSWDYWACDAVHDPWREREWGGEYGPYLVSRFTTGEGMRSTVYFVMSTWNPYTTVLMEATLQRVSDERPRDPPLPTTR